MILRTKGRPEAYDILRHKLKNILKTAPLYASFSIDTENGTVSLLIRGREDLPLEDRQFVYCFDPYELHRDVNEELVNEIVDSVCEYLHTLYPKFHYTITSYVDPTEKDLANMEDYTDLEYVKIKKEDEHLFMLEKLFMKKDFFIARDCADKHFTCGFVCNTSSLDFLENFYSGKIAKEAVSEYLTYVPNPKNDKDTE